MLNNVMNELKELTNKYDCPDIYSNIELTTGVIQNGKNENDASVLTLALSFLLDYGIDHMSIDLMHEVYDLAERLGISKELQSSKSYQVTYKLEDELLNVHPRGINELINVMEDFHNSDVEYTIMPYSTHNTLIIE